MTSWIACSDTGEVGEDAGADVGPPDSGRPRFLCPGEGAGSDCTEPTDCEDDGSPLDNCSSTQHCLAYNSSVCTFGECSKPQPSDLHNLRFDVGDIGIRLESFVGLVIAGETSGGMEVSCEDVYAGFDPADPCVNVLDARSTFVEEGGTLYLMSFNRFASGTRALFAVYGFEQAKAEGAPTGISCTEVSVPPPGSGTQTIGGDRMRPIQ
jgi:hypothetical protein